jgi:hypothetical protein
LSYAAPPICAIDAELGRDVVDENWVCFVKPRGHQSTFCHARTVPNELEFPVEKPPHDALLRPDWRWLIERENSPWYPSLRLFRQRRAGDWEEVVRRVCAALERMTIAA